LELAFTLDSHFDLVFFLDQAAERVNEVRADSG